MNPSSPESSSRRPSARGVALDLLQEVLRRQRPLDEALTRQASNAKLTARDRAFARHMVATTLRRLGQIDALLAACLERPLPAKQALVQDILRLGAAQLLFLDTPAHAAVSTMVDLAGERRQDRARGLVNAILRRLDREGRDLASQQDAAKLNTPDWLWDSWCQAYGEAQTRAIAEVHLAEPPLDLTAKQDAATWARRTQAESLPSGTLRMPPGSGDVRKVAGYEAGAWWVQDAAAAFPARLFGDVAGQTIVDLCAAPGGKTAQLAAAGAQVIAVERAALRKERLVENLARLSLSADCVTADGTSWRPRHKVDGVLLDAPCSATGTLRRHPDIAHLKDWTALDGLLRMQKGLLRAAAEMVKPGGLLIYATCSLQPEEGLGQIVDFLGAGAPFMRAPISAKEIGGLSDAITEAGDLRTLPCHWANLGGIDGFYACRLQRQKA